MSPNGSDSGVSAANALVSPRSVATAVPTLAASMPGRRRPGTPGGLRNHRSPVERNPAVTPRFREPGEPLLTRTAERYVLFPVGMWRLPVTTTTTVSPRSDPATIPTRRRFLEGRLGPRHVAIQRPDDFQDAADVAYLPVRPGAVRVIVVAGEAGCFHPPGDGVTQDRPGLVILEPVVGVVGILRN